jgi:hypothetical protein
MAQHPDRYARQRLIPWWDQERLRAARILVAGAGALGNEVLKNLALLGVGQFVVIDHDRIEPSNLSRAVLFTAADLGRPKVEAAARAVVRLHPEIRVSAIDGDIFYALGLGWLRHCQLAIGCLDNLAARAAQRHACSGFRRADPEEAGEAPTLVTTAAIIGGLLAQEAARFLCGQPVAAGSALVYNGQALTLHRSTLTRNPVCPASHASYAEVRELPCGAADLTPRRLLATALADNQGVAEGELLLELGRDFLLNLACPGCGFSETVNRLLGQVAEDSLPCPRCGVQRRAEVLRSVEWDSPQADWTLAELGVPAAEVLAVWVGEALRLYELTGDVTV